MKKWIVFFIMTGATFYFIIMYDSPGVYRLLAAEAVWFVLSLFQLEYGKWAVQAELLDCVRVADKGADIPLQIEVKNRGRLPVVFSEFFIRMNQERPSRLFSCSLKANERYRAEFSVKAEKAGLCKIGLSRFVCYDLLHLYSGQKKLKKTVSVYVLPKIYPVSMEIRSVFRYYGEESGLYYENDEGDDPSEILEIREYRAGDRLQKIHWKMSQRTGTLMVKEFSEPISFAVVFLLDTRFFSEEYLESFLSISMEMCRERCLHYVCYMESSGVLVRRPVTCEESLYRLLQILMDKGDGRQEKRRGYAGHPDKRRILDEDCYNDWYGMGTYHISLRLTEELELYKQGELAGRIQEQDVEKSLAELMLEL
ncbi:MAG: DUF58 domain-containing protein [Lachnospiraceae bacterium]|nr:DUF58 domain-containing protein [Lachnospiraceae bacterium]